MVEIIPYAEDDDDSSTWVPLSAPIVSNHSKRLDVAASHSNSAADTADGFASVSDSGLDADTRNKKGIILTPNQTDEESSEWHDLSASATSHALPTSSTESAQWSWEKQLISHLTSAATTATSNSATGEEEFYSSENDENIVWRRANELSYDDKLFFQRNVGDTADCLFDSSNRIHDNGREPTLQTTLVSSCSMDQSTQPHQRHEVSSQRASPQSYSRSSSNNNPNYYRDAAKKKLEQSFIYDPMRALPLCFLRNLYKEGKHEFLVVWNAYLVANGGHMVFLPLTFFMFVAFLGVALIVSGALGFGSVVFSVLVHSGATMLHFTLWLIWRTTTHLATVALWGSLLLGILISILMIKSRKVLTVKGLSSKESHLLAAPTISSILPWMVALTSPSLLELFAVLYSLQALTAPIYNESRNISQTAYEFDASSFWMTDLSLLIASFIAFSLVLVSCGGISVFAQRIERNKISCVDDMAASSLTGVKSLEQHVQERFAYINCHLNACHMLSVVILALLSLILASLQVFYLYYRSSLITFISGLGTIGLYLLYTILGVLLLKRAVNAAIAELNFTPNVNRTDECLRLRQRILRNALTKSIIEISSNVVWSNCVESDLTGILSENEGTFRLAMLEWLVDRLVTSSLPSKPTKLQSTSSTMQHPSSSTNVTNCCPERSQVDSENVDSTYVHQSRPSYVSLQKIISKLDADEALLPALQNYRTWVYSLPPSRNVAMMVAIWKMCPGIFALLLIMVWSALTRVQEYLWTMIHFGLLSEQCTNSSRLSSHHITCTKAVLLAPLIFLEYLRVRRWWARVACNISKGQSYDQTKTLPDSLAIMVGYDFDGSFHSIPTEKPSLSQVNHLILHTWHLLLESIDMLESSIPVVRCATLVCAATDLTSDAVCLVDLASEIKNRGLLCGIGMLLIDAFSHHLYEEIRRRRAENNDDHAQDDFEYDIRGKYTGTAINAVKNAAKLAHNVNCLINKAKSDPESNPEMKQGTPDQPISSKTIVLPADEIRNECNAEKIGSESLAMCCDVDSVAHCPYDISDRKCGEKMNVDKGIQEADDQVSDDAANTTDNAGKKCDRNEDDGCAPLWIGGGLAIVGAVVGGLAVAANMKKEESKERTSLSQNSS